MKKIDKNCFRQTYQTTDIHILSAYDTRKSNRYKANIYPTVFNNDQFFNCYSFAYYKNYYNV